MISSTVTFHGLRKQDIENLADVMSQTDGWDISHPDENKWLAEAPDTRIWVHFNGENQSADFDFEQVPEKSAAWLRGHVYEKLRTLTP